MFVYLFIYWHSGQGSIGPGITQEIRSGSKIFWFWDLFLAHNFEARGASHFAWRCHIFKILPGGVETHSKTPIKYCFFQNIFFLTNKSGFWKWVPRRGDPRDEKGLYISIYFHRFPNYSFIFILWVILKTKLLIYVHTLSHIKDLVIQQRLHSIAFILWVILKTQ